MIQAKSFALLALYLLNLAFAASVPSLVQTLSVDRAIPNIHIPSKYIVATHIAWRTSLMLTFQLTRQCHCTAATTRFQGDPRIRQERDTEAARGLPRCHTNDELHRQQPEMGRPDQNPTLHVRAHLHHRVRNQTDAKPEEQASC